MHFCSKMLKNEPKQRGEAPCMIVFCAFDQQAYLIELAAKHGLPNYINLVFRKNFSPQVLKANMKIVGNCEYALLFYRDKLPKFNNNGKMVFNCMDWERDGSDVPKIHTTQKPLKVIKKLIELFTDEGDIVIDPCAGSGSTIVSAIHLNRKAYGFEIKKDFYKDANQWIQSELQKKKDIQAYGYNKTDVDKQAL